MSKGVVIVLVIAGLFIGLVGGAIAGYKYYPKKNKTATTTSEKTATTVTESSTTAASDAAALEACLKAKWGESKYQAISVNPSLASVDDKFVALPCYK